MGHGACQRKHSGGFESFTESINLYMQFKFKKSSKPMFGSVLYQSKNLQATFTALMEIMEFIKYGRVKRKRVKVRNGELVSGYSL